MGLLISCEIKKKENGSEKFRSQFVSQENEEKNENKWNEKMMSRVKVKSNLQGKIN